MPLRQRLASHPQSARFIFQSLCLLLALLLLTAPLRAQDGQAAKRAAAEQAEREGVQLQQQATTEALQQALAKYQEAVPLYQAIGERQRACIVLNNIGMIYGDMGDQQKALDYFNQALPLARATGDRANEAITLSNMGAAYAALGQQEKALDYLKQSLALSQATGDKAGRATTLNNIGDVYDHLGERQQALDYYQQALTLIRVVGDKAGEAITLSNIGSTYTNLGDRAKALDYFNQALQLIRAAGDKANEAIMLSNIGHVYGELGDKQRALDYFNQALPLLRATGNRGGEATTLDNIGGIYGDLGERQKALDYYDQALSLWHAVADPQGEAATLNNIAAAYFALGDKLKAVNYYGQALPLARAAGDKSGTAIILDSIGTIYADIGEMKDALDHFNQALSLQRELGDKSDAATTLGNIGSLYSNTGEKAKAGDYYQQSLALMREVGDRGGEALMLYNLAILERDRANLPAALQQIEAALKIVESLRAQYTNQALSSSYFATVQDYYQFYIDLLMRLHKLHPQEGRAAQALQVSERARARALLDMLSEAGADIRQGVEPQLLARERELQKQLDTAAHLQIKLLSGPHTDEEAATVARALEALTVDYQQVEAEIRQKSPRYAAITQPVPLSLREIQTQVLDADTLLLEYSLGDEHSYLWAVTPDEIKSYELPKRAEIEAAAREVYKLFTSPAAWSRQATTPQRGLDVTPTQTQTQTASPDANAQAAGAPEATQRLSRLVLAPVAAQLGKKRLLVVADGLLQFIPFGALPDPNASQTNGAYQPLIRAHELVSLPSASTLAVLRREIKDRAPAAKELAVLADPVFDSNDERLRNQRSDSAQMHTTAPQTRGLGLGVEAQKAAQDAGLIKNELHIPRLPGTEREAQAIMQLVPAGAGKAALGLAANRATATSEELSHYRYVHFATHGLLDSQRPELSGLLLSMVDAEGQPQDGFLRAHEIFNLKLPAELVVLSACETGLGKDVKGEGMVGLTRGFMYAGAPRVVVSLWSVNDAATAELMTRFYQGILKEKLRPAQALQAAQVALSQDRRYAAPFYWAAFTLQGEWK